jgi:hypothetical protein
VNLSPRQCRMAIASFERQMTRKYGKEYTRKWLVTERDYHTSLQTGLHDAQMALQKRYAEAQNEE